MPGSQSKLNCVLEMKDSSSRAGEITGSYFDTGDVNQRRMQ